MKKVKDFLKKVPKSTMYKIGGGIILVVLAVWMIFITVKINDLSSKKENINTDTTVQANDKLDKTEEIKEQTQDIEEQESNITENKETVESKTNISKNKSNNTKSKSNSSTNDSNKVTTNSSSTQNVTEPKTSNADTEVVAYFNETNTNLENPSLKEKAKENFITIVDFLFYSGKIKGYSFSELTSKAKLQVLKIALSIDKKIDTYFPDYKTKISSTTNRVYTNIKESVVSKYLEITTSICSKDIDTCNQAKSDFQDMKKSFSLTWSFIKNLASKGASNLKEWYEIYSGK